MLKFYTNVAHWGGRVRVRGWNNGRRFQESIPYKPYLFTRSRNLESTTSYRTLRGQPVEKVDFDSIYDAKEFVERYDEVHNFEVYGSTNWPYVYLYDEYRDVPYDPKQISVVNVDIEVGADEFPDPWKADWPITAITIEKNKKVYSLGLMPYEPSLPNVTYILCKNENDLLDKFIQIWLNFDPDVVTGWNIDYFDIPYIVNRVKKLLGDDSVLLLSPWKKIKESTVFYHGSNKTLYELVGITSLDYLPLYKKFSFSNEESYRLDNIAFVVIGEKKLDYSEYESLNDLYKNDFKKYMDYNIHDVMLVSRINDKLGFIEQVFAIAYDSLVNFADTFTSVKIWEIIMHNYLLGQGIVSPPKKHSMKEKQIAGGYVKEPITGRHEWVASFDLNSLYPHLIMQYNISPETFVDVLDELPSDETSPDRIINGFMNDERQAQLREANLALTAGGALYSREKQGFVPVLMEQMYNDRSKFKSMMIEEKQNLEAIEAEMKKRGILT
jgi:DNA polymerase elongation subunit (family B)